MANIYAFPTRLKAPAMTFHVQSEYPQVCQQLIGELLGVGTLVHSSELYAEFSSDDLYVELLGWCKDASNCGLILNFEVKRK